MSTKPLLRNFLWGLDRCGLSPVNQNIRSQVQRAILFVLLLHVTIEQLLYLVFRWNDWEEVDTFTGLATSMQMAYKIGFLILKAKKLKSLLAKVERFRSCKDLAPNIRKDFEKLCDFTLKTMRIFLLTCLVCQYAYVIKPLFIPYRTMPVGTYYPTDCNDSPYYEIMYFTIVNDFSLGCYCIFGFDGLFISIIVHIICEFEVLKQEFSDIKIDPNEKTEDSTLAKVGHLVNHHNLLINCIQSLESIYSLFLLYQFSSSLVCICCGLLSMVVTGFPPDLERILKYVTFLVAAMSQLFIYCMFGEYLTAQVGIQRARSNTDASHFQSGSVSDAVFETDWWVKTQPKLRRYYVVIIQRSNKLEKLTAGGMVDLNSQSFTKMLNFCISFLTMAQALYTRIQSTL